MAKAKLSQENKDQLVGYYKWVRFASIISYISAVIVGLCAIPMLILVVPGLLYIGLAVLMFFMGRSLGRSADSMQKYVESGDDSSMMSSAISMKNYFKVNGILNIVALSFMVVGLLGFAIFAATVDFDKLGKEIQTSLEEQGLDVNNLESFELNINDGEDNVELKINEN